MKTLFTVAFLSLTIILNAQMRSIEGVGEVVKQEIQLETLTGVGLGISGEVILTQGSSQKIVMEGQQNILDNIKREVNGGSWNIEYDRNVRNTKPVKIYITVKTLDEVAVAGSGHISSTNTFKNLDDLDIAVSGSGRIQMSINAQDVETAVSGSGDIILDGTAQTIEAAISGSGNVQAEKLSTTDCSAHISGSGDVTVTCSSKLEAAISGSGDVHYKGNASVKASVSGSGNVSKLQ